MKSKPVGGYPSIKTAVEALSDQGYSNKQIAAKLSISINRVRAASRYRTHVIVPNDIIEELAPYAKTRNIPVSVLIRYLLQTIIYDGVSVDAILDDNGVCPTSKKERNIFIHDHRSIAARELAKKYNISAASVYRIRQIMRAANGAR